MFPTSARSAWDVFDNSTNHKSIRRAAMNGDPLFQLRTCFSPAEILPQ
jgi:hypothetical protein